MAKDYLKFDVVKSKMGENDFENLKGYFAEDEIDIIADQMELGESEYPRVDKYVVDNLTLYFIYHSLGEKSTELAYITITALVDDMIAVTSKMVQVSATFAEEESGEVLKMLRELLQEEYSVMRQFLYNSKSVSIESSQNRAKRLRDNLDQIDKDEKSEHKGCMKALLFEMLYVFPPYRKQHVFETIVKIIKDEFGSGINLCMSTHSSGQQVDPDIAEIAGKAVGLEVTNEFMHLCLDSDVKFAYCLDDKLKEQANLLHTV